MKFSIKMIAIYLIVFLGGVFSGIFMYSVATEYFERGTVDATHFAATRAQAQGDTLSAIQYICYVITIDSGRYQSYGLLGDIFSKVNSRELASVMYLEAIRRISSSENHLNSDHYDPKIVGSDLKVLQQKLEAIQQLKGPAF